MLFFKKKESLNGLKNVDIQKSKRLGVSIFPYTNVSHVSEKAPSTRFARVSKRIEKIEKDQVLERKD